MKPKNKIFNRFRVAFDRDITGTDLLSSILFYFIPVKLADRLSLYYKLRFKGHHFRSRPIDRVAIEEVFLKGEYNFITLLLAQTTNPKVVDLGAHIGTFAIFVFSNYPRAVVYSVEPNPQTYRLLMHNRRENLNLNWNIYQAAIWNTNGQARLETMYASTASHVSPNGTEIVPTITLSDFLKDQVGTKIDLLKIDIEGAEEVVLLGNEKLLSVVDNLIIELHPDQCHHFSVIEMLQNQFNFLYQISDRGSKKPLLCASRMQYNLPKFLY